MCSPDPRMSSRPVPAPALAVDEGHAALLSLFDDWDHLHRNHPIGSPFQSAGWASAYCDSYGTDGLVTVASRDGGELEAVAAFRRQRRPAARVLVSAPPHVSDYNDVLLRSSAGSAARLVQVLLNTPGWDVLDFREVPPSADLWRVVRSWPGKVLRVPASECVVLDGHRLEDFAGTLPRLKQKQLRQQQRGIVRAGVTIKLAEGDPEAAVRTLLAFHRQAWTGRGMNPEHATAQFQELLVHAVRRLSLRRQAVVMEFHQSGRVLGAALYLTGLQSVGVYLSGHHADLRDQVNLHVLDTIAGFELVADLGLGQLNMLRGAEAYKLRWPVRRERNERVVLVRPGSAIGRTIGFGIRGRRSASAVVREGRERLASWRLLTGRLD